ncbi:MAG: insulinase family protein [Defluviitaleaceae bacterium]|nr:insulinase family protein [Defluviitaleaceae bacterium]
MEETRHNAVLGESLYINRLQNGLTCYIMPKKNYVAQTAMLCVNYGSVDARFAQGGREYAPPKGIAHFLEHKMFEDADVNLFDEFVKQGADVNAYTNFRSTAYYFNCNERFYDNLRLLMHLVTVPHFTDENVEKEKGIIAQEISMYDDNPFWRGYFNMQRAMYAASAVRDNIVGDAKSISRITPEDLHRVHSAFYRPANMALICVGRFAREEVYKTARKAFVGTPELTATGRLCEAEPPGVAANLVSGDMSLSKPIFSLGFKDVAGEMFRTAKESSTKVAATKVLMDILAGASSELFNALYREGLVTTPISLEYISGRGFSQAVFGAASSEPEQVRERILCEIKKTRRRGVDTTRFEQIRNKHVGRFFRLFNSIDAMRNLQADLFASGDADADIFGLFEAYAELKAKDLDARLQGLFREDNYVLSIMR